MAQRAGFQIPNAKDVAVNDLAEPDSSDFSILGNHRNGVVKGCGYTFDGATGVFTVVDADNLVVRSGVAETIPTSAAVTVEGAGPAFYLVVWGPDASGTVGLTVVTAGVSVDNPVFPDLTDDTVVLAAVYAPQTGNKSAIDKRLFLGNGASGWVGPSEKFLHHRTGDGTNFAVLGDGTVQWGTGSDPKIYRSLDALRVNSDLVLDGHVSVDGVLSGTSAAFTGNVTAANLRRGSSAPSSGDGTAGDLYQRTDGSLYLRGASSWQQILPTTSPVGTLISSISATAPAGGWLAMGGTYSGTDYPDLWDILPSAWKDEATTSFTLPSMGGRTLVGATGAVQTGGSSSVQLVEANLPSHKHFSSGNLTTSVGGTHSHAGSSIGEVAAHTHTVNLSGEHGHAVSDPGHSHAGVDFFGYPAGVVYAAPGGQNKLDGLFNDSSHTYSVEVSTNIKASTTGVSVSTSNSKHAHTLQANGRHSHSLTVSASDTAHSHTLPAESSVGSGTPFDVVPAHLTVYYYIKA